MRNRYRSRFLHNGLAASRVRKESGVPDREFRRGKNEPISRQPWTNRQIHRIKLNTQQAQRQRVIIVGLSGILWSRRFWPELPTRDLARERKSAGRRFTAHELALTFATYLGGLTTACDFASSPITMK